MSVPFLDDVDAEVNIRTDGVIVTPRRRGRVLAEQSGFSTTDQVLITTAISELARNILLYARGGVIAVRRVVNHERLKGRPYPDAEMELERLERKYGRDVDTDDKPFVFAVYGQGPLGVAALRKAIEETALAERGEEVDPLS